MLDRDLAALYNVNKGTETSGTRNRDRFPADFMFQLNKRVWVLEVTFVTSIPDRKASVCPMAFTEQGCDVVGLLKSPRAVEVNIEIMRAFVRLREIVSTNVEFSASWMNSNANMINRSRSSSTPFAN